MNEALELLVYSAKAVISVFLVAGAGVFLIRLEIISKDALKILSKIVFTVMLPCLIFTKISASVNLENLINWWVFPSSALLYIIIGTILGLVVVKVCNPGELLPETICSCSFGNSGYIPIPIIMAAATIFPFLKKHPDSADLGIAYISVYILVISPIMWSLGYGLIGRKKLREMRFSHILTPPVLAMFCGIIAGLLPPLKKSICAVEGLLFPAFKAMEIIGMGTVPCVLIVLGGLLSSGPAKGSVPVKAVTCIIIAKLVLLPVFALIYVKSLMSLKVIPSDPLFALILIIEAGVPPANALVIMCSLVKKGTEESMAAIIFWTYLASIFTLTFFMMVTMWLFT